MEYRKFTSLTDDEVRQIVNDMFSPKKITCIKRSKKYDEITCKIYTEWNDGEDDFVMADELILKDPFKYGEWAIHINMSVHEIDYIRLKQFCIAKGICPEWYRNNPYMQNHCPYCGKEIDD